MKEERKVIETNITIVFDGDIKASQLNSLKYFRGNVVIQKQLIVDKDLSLKCNLYVMGKILKKGIFYEHSINVRGDLWCKGEITCNDINVNGSMYCEEDIYSNNISVGEDFLCDGKVNAYNYDVVVAGDIIAQGIVASRVEYFGEVTIEGLVSVVNGMKSCR